MDQSKHRETGTHVKLFPMAALAEVMRTEGFVAQNSRKHVASCLADKIGAPVAISPKYHEAFNYISDVLLRRIVPTGHLWDLVNGLARHMPSINTPQVLVTDMLTYLDPQQAQAIKIIQDQIDYNSDAPIDNDLHDAFGTALAAAFFKAHGDKYLRNVVFRPLFVRALIEAFEITYTAWSAR